MNKEARVRQLIAVPRARTGRAHCAQIVPAQQQRVQDDNVI